VWGVGSAFADVVGLADTALSALSKLFHSNATEQFSQTFPQSSGNLLDIHQRHVPDSSFDTAVVRAMQPTSLRSLFLIDLLLLAYSAGCAAKTDACHRGWQPAKRSHRY